MLQVVERKAVAAMVRPVRQPMGERSLVIEERRELRASQPRVMRVRTRVEPMRVRMMVAMRMGRAAGESEEGDGEGEGADGEAAGDEAGGEGGTSEEPKEASAAVAVRRVDAQRASENLASGDARATSRTLQGLNLPDVRNRSTPTPAAIVNSLQQVRQRIMSGAPPR